MKSVSAPLIVQRSALPRASQKAGEVQSLEPSPTAPPGVEDSNKLVALGSTDEAPGH